MNLIPLFNTIYDINLPPEIIYNIYLHVLYNKSQIIISRFYRFRKKKLNTISYLIESLIFNNLITNNHQIDNSFIISDNTVDNIRFITHNNFPKKYTLFFWKNILSLISFSLMRINLNISMRNLNLNKNKSYRNLKIAIGLWFKLCVKYNISLELIYTNNNNNSNTNLPNIDYVFARHIKPIKNFNKYLWSPKICYSNNIDVIDNTQASIFLLNYL